MFNNKEIQSRKGKDDSISTFKVCKDCWREEHPFYQGRNRHKSAEKEEKAEESNAAEVTNQFSFFGMTCTTGRRDPDNDRLVAHSKEEDTAMHSGTKWGYRWNFLICLITIEFCI